MIYLVQRTVILDHKYRHNRDHFQPEKILEYKRQHQMTVDGVAEAMQTSATRKLYS